MLNECIGRYFFPSRAKEAKKQKRLISGYLKVSIFNSQNRCKVVVPDELGRELEHFNWALFRRFITDIHTNPLQSLANLFTLKPKRIKLARYLKMQIHLVQQKY